MAEILQQFNQDMIRVMKTESGVLGAWEFGAGMHHTRDAYSDIDIVFLLAESDYLRIDRKLREILEQLCDTVLIFWAEEFNGESIRNYDCLLERDGCLFQYDIFLLNDASIDDYMCKIHYMDLKKEHIYFEKDGRVSALLDSVLIRHTWQDDILRLIDTYWLHVHMSAKYLLRKDYFKLEGLLRTLMDTHTYLLLTVYDRITWGGTANKLHYLSEEKQNHLKRYYCDEDLHKTEENLRQSMLWFEEDIQELDMIEAVGRNHAISVKVKDTWQKMLIFQKQ